MKNKNLLSFICTLVVMLGSYYFMLPPINLTSFEFYAFLAYVVIVFLVFKYIVFSGFSDFNHINNLFKKAKNLVIILSLLGVMFGLIFIVNFVFSPFFFSSKYSNRINVTMDGEFASDVEKVDFSHIPLLDKDSSQRLGDRVMGQLPELVSQFYVSSLYTQINYNNQIIRVTPLEYNGFIKYLSNRNEGVKGYITVDSGTGEAELVKLDEGMKYMPSAYFFENLNRKLRFSYPTLIFGDISFEIDNEGNPYWVAPIIKYTGVGLLRDISGVVLLNAVDGSSVKYDIDEVPSWVDHVYSADLIIEQVDDWGLYREGFWNSVLGQKNVVMTTDGYNYLTLGDDVYLYTGITSVASDEANIGFILTNMRTKETVFYSVPGAEEYSAMASAEGQVQQMRYTATFPLLINLNNKPTYLISLKDSAGLVKMYAFVDVEDYQKVVVTDAVKGIDEAARNYLNNFSSNNDDVLVENIIVNSISSANINGNTYYYIVSKAGDKYRVSINCDQYNLPFVKNGDELVISYTIKNDIRDTVKIEIK